MPSQATTLPLQPHHVSNLILILRRANSYYSKLAAQVRSSLRPTHHARTRAHKLGLGVDIGKAIRLDPRQISVVPLPILDVHLSPDAQVVEHKDASPPRSHPALKCIIPSSVQSSMTSSASKRDDHSASESASSVYRKGNASRWSSTPTDVGLLSPLELTCIDVDCFASASDDMAASVDPDTDCHLRPSKPSRRLGGRRTRHRPDVPVDEAAITWGHGDLNDMDISSPSSSRSSSESTYYAASSGSDSDSSGPITPEVPVVLHIKRKSVEIPDSEGTFEKRPKFERKDWVLPVAQRKNIIRIPPLCRLANEQVS